MLEAQSIFSIEKINKSEANFQQMIKRRRFLKLKEKKASTVFLSIIIQIEKNVYSLISIQVNAFSKNF